MSILRLEFFSVRGPEVIGRISRSTLASGPRRSREPRNTLSQPCLQNEDMI